MTLHGLWKSLWRTLRRESVTPVLGTFPGAGNTRGSNSRDSYSKGRKKNLKTAGALARARAREAWAMAERRGKVADPAYIGVHENAHQSPEEAVPKGTAKGSGREGPEGERPFAHTEASLRELLGPMDGCRLGVSCCPGFLTWIPGVEPGLWTCRVVHRTGCPLITEHGVEFFEGAVWRIVWTEDHQFGTAVTYAVCPESHYEGEVER